MASVRVAGRFPAGAVVALVEVEGPWVLRAQVGRTLERKRVDEDGVVTFDGLEGQVGSSYFVVGQAEGQPVEVRAKSVDDPDDAVRSQAPHGRDPQVLADGTELSSDDLGVEDEEIPLPGNPGDEKPRPARKRWPRPARKRLGGKGKAKAGGKRKAPAEPKDDEKPLAGQALKDKASELEVEGRGSMSADDLRAAVAAKEAAAA